MTAITIGKFDGLHLGHKKIIDTLLSVSATNNMKSILVTFSPHPNTVFSGKTFYSLLTEHEKKSIALSFGIDEVYFLPFDENVAATDPKLFVKHFFREELNCGIVVAGEGFRFGKDRRGNAETIREQGIKVISVSAEEKNDKKISSADIRRLVSCGNFPEVSKTLGYNFFITGVVCEGKKLGRKIGFPTANVLPQSDKLLPPNGVYVTKTEIENNSLFGVTNVGVTPTFGGKTKVVETHFLNFSGDVYGKSLKTEFYCMLREETKFESIEKLKEQILIDCMSTDKLLKKSFIFPLKNAIINLP